MKKYNKLVSKLDEQIDSALKKSSAISEDMNKYIQDNNDLLDTYRMLDDVIADIDEEFAGKTSIRNKKDQMFLWTAIALQTARWILLPEFKTDEITEIIEDKNDRNDAGKEGEKDEEGSKKYLDDNDDSSDNKDGSSDDKDNAEDNKDDSEDESKYLDWQEYFKRPVPYDALNGDGTKETEIKGVTPKDKNLAGKNHHSATLGHDPVLGYIFGTINIMTYTLTFHKSNLQTNRVELMGKAKTTVAEEVGFVHTFSQAIGAEIDDTKRIPAAVSRQAIHMASDYNTKMGLPLPFLTAEKQQEFLKKGWNSKELKRIINSLKTYAAHNAGVVSAQLLISLFINLVIQSLHKMMYDEESDGILELYQARTKKILAVSNTIASLMNFVYVAGNVIVGVHTTNAETIAHGLKKIDIGGYVETVHQIVSNCKLQEQIRRKYLEDRLYEKFVENNYTFMEDE